MHKFSHFWWKSLDGKFENITQSTHYGGGLEHRLREWVLKFFGMTISEEAVHQFSASTSATTASEPLKAGWALQKPRGSGTRFSERVKQYLQSCFDLGVQTGRKADPARCRRT